MTTTPAAVYCRVSTEKQAEEIKLSLQVQEENCRAWCRERQFEVPDEECVAREIHTSTTFDRPELERLLAVMAHRGIKRLVMDRVNRVTREGSVAAANFVHRLREAGVTLHIVLENLTLDNPNSDQMFLMYAFGAQQENVNRTRATQSARRAMARVFGRYVKSNRPPFGFAFEDQGNGVIKLVHDPETFPVLERIINERRAGKSFHRIADELTRDNIPTATARAKHRKVAAGWQGTTVRQVLANPVVSGQVAGFRTKSEWMPADQKHDHRWRKITARPPEEQVALPTTIVEDPPLTASEQRRLAAKKPMNPRRLDSPSLFPGGTMRHAGCKANLRAKATTSNGHYYVYYVCDKHEKQPSLCPGFKTHAEPLDMLVWSAVRRVLLEPGRLEQLAEAQIKADTGGGPESELGRLRKMRSDFERQKQHLTDAIAEAPSAFVRQNIMERLDRLGPDIADATQRIREYEQIVARTEARRKLIRDVSLQIRHYEYMLVLEPRLTHPQARARIRTILSALGLRGEVDRGPDGRLVVKVSLLLDEGLARPWFTPEEVERHAERDELSVRMARELFEHEGAFTDWLQGTAPEGVDFSSLPPDMADATDAANGIAQIGTVEFTAAPVAKKIQSC